MRKSTNDWSWSKCLWGLVCQVGLAVAIALSAVPMVTAQPAPSGDKISNPVARFTGLDKITGRIISFDVMIGETVQFGALRVTPRTCFTRPADETQQTSTFIEVDEVTLNNKVRRIFTGWMFASSPGLNAIEHPVYDVWLIACRGEMGGPDEDLLAGTDADGDGVPDDPDALGVAIPRPKPASF